MLPVTTIVVHPGTFASHETKAEKKHQEEKATKAQQREESQQSNTGPGVPAQRVMGIGHHLDFAALGKGDIGHRTVRKAHLVEGDPAQRQPDDDYQGEDQSKNIFSGHYVYLHNQKVRFSVERLASAAAAEQADDNRGLMHILLIAQLAERRSRY